MTEPKQYRKRPIVVEAYVATERTIIKTLEGDMLAEPGDYIIRGIKGEYYPCKPDVFEATYYESVESTPEPGQKPTVTREQRDKLERWFYSLSSCYDRCSATRKAQQVLDILGLEVEEECPSTKE